MADILIRGMSMPEDCGKCVVKYFTPCYEEKNLCPLTELPPHGRLIDVDELIKEHGVVFNFSTLKWVDEVSVSLAPTVIEASEVE